MICLGPLRKKLILALRLARANRWWVWTNRRLFLRTKASGVRGAADSDWVFKLVFSRPRSSVPRVMGLVLDLGRFGNAVSRISKACAVAFEHEWTGLVVPQAGHFPAYKHLISSNAVGREGFNISFGHDRWSWDEVPRYLVRREFYFAHADPDQRIQITVRDLVRDVFPGLAPPEPLDPSHLVIHVRSGDIYFREGLGNWGQPPFAFYEAVLASAEWTQVTVVCEDAISPVIEPIRDLCQALEMHYQFQSSSLEDDLYILTSARSLVVGRGTFAPAVVILNPHLDTVFFFEDRFSSNFLLAQTKVVRITDSVGEYTASVLQGNWANSEEQREMMLSYPVVALQSEVLQNMAEE